MGAEIPEIDRRPEWSEVWMDVALSIARRSRCVRRQVGAVVVGPSNRIVSTGYNGPPAGFPVNWSPTCAGWCERATAPTRGLTYSDCVSVHAESNALVYADRRLYEGGTLYVTDSPCWDCAKLVANSGVKHVVMRLGAKDDHRDPDRSISLLMQCGVGVGVVLV